MKSYLNLGLSRKEFENLKIYLKNNNITDTKDISKTDIQEWKDTGSLPGVKSVQKGVDTTDYGKNGNFRNTGDLMNNLTSKGYKNLSQEGDYITGIDSEGNRAKWNIKDGFANKEVTGKESIWGDYKEYNPTDQEIKDIADAEAKINDPYFQRQKDTLTTDYQKNIDEINKLSQYSKTDYATNLMKTNKIFATSMSNATRAYGQRNLLGSGIMKENANENINSLDKDLYNMADYQKRKEEGFVTQKDNYKTKYNEGMQTIGENQDYTNYFNTIKNINEKKQAYIQNYQNTQLGLPTTGTTPSTSLTNRITDITKK